MVTAWMRYTHVYQPDGVTDLLGAESCVCGIPRRNALHKVKPTDDAVKEAESRRLGERENT